MKNGGVKTTTTAVVMTGYANMLKELLSLMHYIQITLMIFNTLQNASTRVNSAD